MLCKINSSFYSYLSKHMEESSKKSSKAFAFSSWLCKLCLHTFQDDCYKGTKFLSELLEHQVFPTPVGRYNTFIGLFLWSDLLFFQINNVNWNRSNNYSILFKQIFRKSIINLSCCCKRSNFSCFISFYVQRIKFVRPTSKLHGAVLIIKWKPCDINLINMNIQIKFNLMSYFWVK